MEKWAHLGDEMSRVLVLDEGARPGIEVVRSLGRAGIDIVIVTENGRRTVGSMSRYVSKRVSCTSFYDNSTYLDEIIRSIKENDCDMIMPVGDVTTELVSKNKEQISDYAKVPVPDYSTWIKATDKALALKSAIDQGIPCPLTYFDEVNNIQEIRDFIGFPLIIKPRRSNGSKGVSYVKSEKEFFPIYRKIKSLFGVPLVQEYIPSLGKGYGVSGLLKNGVPIALFSHKRLREYPRSGGPSTLRESIRNPVIEAYALELLKSFKWHGVAMVEFKEDVRGGGFKLMEINPRFWGSLSLAVKAGIDFPYILYKLCMNEDIKPAFNYEIGIRSRWLIGDVLWLFSSNNKKRDFKEFCKNGEKCYFDTISKKDPAPFFGELITDLHYLNKNLDVFKRGIKS